MHKPLQHGTSIFASGTFYIILKLERSDERKSFPSKKWVQTRTWRWYNAILLTKVDNGQTNLYLYISSLLCCQHTLVLVLVAHIANKL